MLWPILAMVLLTYVVLAVNFVWRVQAYRAKQMPLGYLKLLVATNVPERLIAGKNHYANLFEIPVLFYVACLLALHLAYQPKGLIVLAWVYVGCRIAHGVIHMGGNQILPRIFAFWSSALVLLAMWLSLAFHIIGYTQ